MSLASRQESCREKAEQRLELLVRRDRRELREAQIRRSFRERASDALQFGLMAVEAASCAGLNKVWPDNPIAGEHCIRRFMIRDDASAA